MRLEYEVAILDSLPLGVSESPGNWAMSVKTGWGGEAGGAWSP